ncbi:hypothetical protein JR065_07460 [Xanthomonas sp. AmX2]|uniref:hypothetical protein n=1 Tax=Xanthomonas sp. TaxID=29446 RepID=UPI00197EE716|nr:hypothetical protein [Xanthomonas sp.]MBN6150173.1 hypothetical protein [Xanthomonas sp.]
MSVTTKARQRRLGVRQARTSNSANLWTLQSPTAELPVTLSGDLRMKLFFHCEGDPTVRDAEYREQELEVPLSGGPVCVDALVTLIDGSIQARMIDDGSDRARRDIEAVSAGCGYSMYVLSIRDFGRSEMRIRNWQAAISAFHRSRDADLTSVAEDVELIVRRRGRATLGEVMQCHRQNHPAVVIGATVLVLRARAIASDMDANPWCTHTRLLRCQHDFKP